MDKFLCISFLLSIVFHFFVLVSFHKARLTDDKIHLSKNLGLSQSKASIKIIENRKKSTRPKKKLTKKSKHKVLKNLQSRNKQKSEKNVGKLQSGQDTLIAEYLLIVRNLLKESQVKLRTARRMGLVGSVKLEFVIKKPNIISDIEIIQKSKYIQLDLSALKTVSSLSDIPEIPAKINKEEISVTVVISYE